MKDIIAKDIMVTNVFTVSDDWILENLIQFLTQQNISGAPVLNNEGNLIGVVSVTDIVNFHRDIASTDDKKPTPSSYYYPLQHMHIPSELKHYYPSNYASVKVREIMIPVLFDVEPSTPLPEITELMVTANIHRVIVTCDKKPVGIITAHDILKILNGYLHDAHEGNAA